MGLMDHCSEELREDLNPRRRWGIGRKLWTHRHLPVKSAPSIRGGGMETRKRAKLAGTLEGSWAKKLARSTATHPESGMGKAGSRWA